VRQARLPDHDNDDSQSHQNGRRTTTIENPALLFYHTVTETKPKSQRKERLFLNTNGDTEVLTNASQTAEEPPQDE
jgi:hypothetical protein